MIHNFINTVSESCPQLLREIKGRLKPINLMITTASSLLLQLVFLLYQIREIPGLQYSLRDRYCLAGNPYLIRLDRLYKQKDFITGKLSHHDLNFSQSNLKLQIKQIESQIKNLENYLDHSFCPADKIEWHAWSRDHWESFFLSFTVIFVFVLLVAGTYLLINDLAKEEKLGTLNFIRLSPRPDYNILMGKMLGVPSLIYVFVLTAIPLHLWAGHGANIPLSYIFIYYLVMLANCYLFYSAAMLFALCSRRFSNFIPWVGSGTIAIFLWVEMSNLYYYLSYDFPVYHTAIIWLRFMTPWEMINYLFPNLFRVYSNFPYRVTSSELYNQIKHPLSQLEFLYLPIGKNLLSLVSLYLINCAICAHGIWQVMKRSFRRGNTTILSKRQSYLLMAFCQLVSIGLAPIRETFYPEENYLPFIVVLQTLFSIVLCLALIFAISPHRQIIQEWARYRHQNNGYKSLWRDLVYGEKSPAFLAIAINIVIAFTPVIIWVLFLPEIKEIAFLNKTKFLLGVILFTMIAMIYAKIFKLILLVKSSNRYIYAIATLSFLVLLPTVIPSFIDDQHQTISSSIWLFSPFPWLGMNKAVITGIYSAIFAEFAVLVLLNFQLKKQLKMLGESSSKALLTRR